MTCLTDLARRAPLYRAAQLLIAVADTLDNTLAEQLLGYVDPRDTDDEVWEPGEHFAPCPGPPDCTLGIHSHIHLDDLPTNEHPQ